MKDRSGSSVPVGDFRMQPFGPEIVEMVDRHARATAVAINDFLAGAGEGQVPGRPVVRWENRRRLLWVWSSSSPPTRAAAGQLFVAATVVIHPFALSDCFEGRSSFSLR